MPPDTRAIMRALKATTPNPQAGGYSTVAAPSISPGPSPLVASYSEWTSGRSYGSQGALPRDPATFLSGMFGPLAPIRPVPVDTPEPGEERPEPRRWQYNVGWNMPLGMPGTEGVGKLANFQTLRTIADLYSVARACIELRKSELRGIGWDITLTKNAAKALRGDRGGMKDFAARKAAAVRFFSRPDPMYSDFSSWFDALLEEVFVTDALAIYSQPALSKKKGLLGSSIAALDLLDGTLIRPLVDIRGGRPVPPNPAFQQFLYGVPRVDLMTLLLGEDNPDEQKIAAEYRADQLMYLPFSQRTWTPYGQAPIERAIIPVMTGLNKQQYQLNFFQEGSIPGLFVSPGDPNMTPTQIRELQDALNALAGDQAWKHKIIVLPGGSKVDPQKPVSLADQFDEIVMVQVCMAFNVMPMELGITPRVSTTQTMGAGNQMAKQCYTGDMEILTRRGWLPFRAVSTGDKGDEFATRNPKTQAFEWQHATAYHESDYDGELIEFTSTHGRQAKDEGLHLRVTPNHRMVTVEPVSKTKPVEYREYIREAGGIGAQRISVPLTSTWEGHGPQSVLFGQYEWTASDFAAFLGAYIAEGHLRRQRGNYKRAGRWVQRPEGQISKQICISQRETSKGYEPYRKLLTRMLGHVPCHNHGTFIFACAELWDYLNELGHAHEKHIPVEVKDWSAPVLRSLLDFYLLGDGHLENGHWRSATVSRQLADDLQEIAQKLGMSATITPRQPRDVMIRGRLIAAENCRDVYFVRFNKSLTRRMTISRTHYTGKIYCVTVPNGVIYVRSNGSPVWCGNSQDTQERKGTVPLLKWMKCAIFDTILQGVCGQDDLEWTWEGLEENEDAEMLTNLLVQQVSTGMRSIDEARAELGLDPWNLPATSDPGWSTVATGFVPFTAQLTPPPMPGQQPQQQQQPQPRQQARPDTPPPLPGQRPQSALTAPRNPTGAANDAGTPAHAGAQASTAARGGKPSGRKARELDLLRSYLRKGGDPGGWQARDLPGVVMAAIGEDLAKGLTVDEVIATARGVLVKDAADLTDPNPVEAEHVINQMRKNYPDKALGWMQAARWIGPVQIPVNRIDFDDIHKWAASHQQARVRVFARQIETGEAHTQPIVAVQEPGDDKIKVIDGHHRTLAYKQLGRPVKAYVGFVDTDGGPWDQTHAFQFHQGADPANKTGGGGGPKPGAGQNPGWEHDQALARRAARKLAAGLAAVVSSRALARNWLARRPFTGSSASIWLQDTAVATAIQTVLTRILRGLWADAYMLGRRAAAAILGHPDPGADTAGLQQVLAQAMSRISGMTATRVDAITSLLDDGAGVPAGTLEADLKASLGNLPAALTVTQTEVTWAIAEGMAGYYRQAGVQAVTWVTDPDSDRCGVCIENEEAGPRMLGELFPSGAAQPPQHPNCRCALRPAAVQPAAA